MDERDFFDGLKRVGKRIIKAIWPFILKGILPIALIFLIIFSATYVIKLDDGTKKDGDKKNVPNVVSTNNNSVSYSTDGSFSTSKSAQEVWDDLIKNGGRANLYLDNASQLKKLMDAELVTQYLDTRPSKKDNPTAKSHIDDEIDWDSISKDTDSKEIQGIVKLKRADTDGNTNYITYVDENTFQGYIDDYNSSGSEEAKKNALTHFTIHAQLSSSGNTGTAQLIEEGTAINIPSGLGTTHTFEAWDYPFGNDSFKWASGTNQLKFWKQADGMNSYDEDCLGKVNGRYVIACTTTYGKVGDYIDFYLDDGTIIPCVMGDAKNQSDSGCNKWGHLNGECILEFMVKTDPWYDTYYKQKGIGEVTKICHPEWGGKTIVKAVNGGSYFDNPSFGANDNGGKVEEKSTADYTQAENMKWPTDGTQITSKFGDTAGRSHTHRGIDIGVPVGTNIYACESGTVTAAGEYGTAGYMITIDHGNGYVSKYMHLSQFKVKVGDSVNKGDVIALSGGAQGAVGAGNSTGPHLHFQIEKDGTAVDPLALKFDNGMGSGVEGIGNNVGNNENAEVTYIAKVATWTETTVTVKSNDPNRESETGSTTTYTMTTKDINYRNAINGYTMPFDYLWAWLVVTEDKDFVFDVADLVYNSNIEITVFDNLSIDVSSSRIDYSRNIAVKDENGNYKRDGNGNIIYNTTNYYIETTTTVKNDTLIIDVTKANVWIVDFNKEYKYQKLKDGSNSYSAEPATRRDKIDKRKKTEVCVDIENSLDKLIEENKEVITDSKETLKEKLKNSTGSEQEYEFYSGSVEYKIVAKNVSSMIKQDDQFVQNQKTKYYLYRIPEYSKDQDNFVKALIRNRKAFKAVEDAAEWLFEIIEKNEPDMLELTKYLIYVATDRLYSNVSDYNFDVFNPADFEPISSGFVGANLEEKIWWMLKDIGYSDYAAAGVMGNLSAETDDGSSIHSNLEEVKGSADRGIGIVQWSFGRHTNLVKYAESQGTTWKDEDIQLEFLKAELTGGGCGGFATNQWTSDKNNFLESRSTDDAAYYFMIGFERPNLSIQNGRIDVRRKGATYYYKMFHGKKRPSGSSGTILSMCRQVMNELLKNHVIYSVSENYLVWGNIKESSDFSKHRCCCATYVSVVLYKSGALSEDFINKYNYNLTGVIGGNNVNTMLRDAGWKHVSESEAQPGDVCVWDGHTFIYAGGDKVWDQQTGCISSDGTPPKRGAWNCWEHWKSRHDIDVWRKP